MSSSDLRLRELGGFLKAWRAKLSPDDVGLPDTGIRRVQGLRHEEVARLIGRVDGIYRSCRLPSKEPAPPRTSRERSCAVGCTMHARVPVQFAGRVQLRQLHRALLPTAGSGSDRCTEVDSGSDCKVPA